MPLIFFTIVPTFVNNMDLFRKNAEGYTIINKSHLVYLIVTSIISIFVIVYDCYLSTRGYQVITKKKYDELIDSIDSISADANIALKLLSVFDDICSRKEYVIFKLIKQNKENNEKYSVITEPANQLQQIFKNGMCETLRELFDFNDSKNKIEVSVAYRYGNGQDWQWLESYEPNHRCTAQNLATNPNTTFFELIMSKSNYVFHNSKFGAAINGNYVKNDQNTLDWSIIGRRIYIGSYESPYAEIIYFFTTNNNNKLIQRNNAKEEKIVEINSSRKLEDYFFNKFDYRIKIEFELLYLKENSKC